MLEQSAKSAKSASAAALVRAPVQKRSREALARIYDAVNLLLEGKVFDQITLAEIAAQADVAIGSIYQRFENKDGLLWALYQFYVDDARTRAAKLVENSDELDRRVRIRAAIKFVCSCFRDHRGIVRSLLLRYRADPQSVLGAFSKELNEVNAAIEFMIAGARGINKNAIGVRALILAACREHILFDAFDEMALKTKRDTAFVDMLTNAAFAAYAEKKE